MSSVNTALMRAVFGHLGITMVCINNKGFTKFGNQGGVKATVSGVVEDLKFKISEGSDPNWS